MASDSKTLKFARLVFVIDLFPQAAAFVWQASSGLLEKMDTAECSVMHAVQGSFHVSCRILMRSDTKIWTHIDWPLESI